MVGVFRVLDGVRRRCRRPCAGKFPGAPCDLFLQLADRLVELGALGLHFLEVLEREFVGLGQLRHLAVVHVIKIEQLADFLEVETEPLAAQDQLEPGAVALGEQALVAFPDRKQQLLGLVETQGARRHVKAVTHLSDRHGLVFGHAFASGFGMCRAEVLASLHSYKTR